MAFSSLSSIPLDILPDDVMECWQELADHLDDPTNRHFEVEALELLCEPLYHLREPEARVRYLLQMLLHVKLSGFFSLNSTALEIEQDFYRWYSTHLLESLCALAGTTKLRKNKSLLATDWESVSQRDSNYSENINPLSHTLLRFSFCILAPSLDSSGVKSIIEPILNIKSESKRANTFAEKSSVVQPSSIDTLCCNGLKRSDVVALAVHLGAASETSGLWHLGSVSGKGAKMLSVFPAIYRALVEAKRMHETDAPVWRSIFMELFKVEFSHRLANYTQGKGSMQFSDSLREARRWISHWMNAS